MRGQSVKPAVGDTAPELNLPTEAGGAFSLAHVHGHPTLVSFLSHAA